MRLAGKDLINSYKDMRKKIILLLIYSVLVLLAQAQGFKGGLHLGLLATQVDGDEHSGYKKAGLFAGVFTNYSFHEKKTQLQFELNYAQKGSSANPFHRIVLHQVEPTVLVEWNFWKKLCLEGGLGFNIVPSAKRFANQVKVTTISGNKFYIFHLEGIAGLDYRINEHFGASFRFNYSTPIGTGSRERQRKQLEGYLYNNCLLFRAYYQF